MIKVKKIALGLILLGGYLAAAQEIGQIQAPEDVARDVTSLSTKLEDTEGKYHVLFEHDWEDNDLGAYTMMPGGVTGIQSLSGGIQSMPGKRKSISLKIQPPDPGFLK